MRSLTTIDLALELLDWPGRRLNCDQPVISLALNTADTAAVRASFCTYLEREYRHLPVEDIKSSVIDFCKKYPTLPGWYASLFDCSGIDIEVANWRVGIAPGKIEVWRRITQRIDPDGLIAFSLVRGRLARCSDLKEWRTFPAVADPALGRLFERGIADIHLHLEGCEPLPLLWLRLMKGQTRFEILERYQPRQLQLLHGTSEYQKRTKEQHWFQQARGWRERLARLTGVSDSGALIDPDYEWESLRTEREMLYRAWNHRGAVLRLIDWEDRPASGKGELNFNLVQLLDSYLAAKNHFIKVNQQSRNTNPGLGRFRHYFDRSRERRNWQSPRVEAIRHQRMLGFLSESRGVEGLELRISPFDTLPDYMRFFLAWQKAEIGLRNRLGNQQPEVRFVVHFIRQHPASAGNDDLSVPPFHRLRCQVARQSAMLQLFLHRYPDFGSRIVGVDVANLERDCPPEIFTPFLRLLRGETSLMDQVEGPDTVCLRPWRALHAHDYDVPPVYRPPLGLTFHAGEEFYHPLGGMVYMDGVVRGCRMRAGDRIGHGLAADWDFEEFYRVRGKNVWLPQGALLDDLTWFYCKLSEEGIGKARFLSRLKDEIGRLSRSIYGEHLVPEELSQLWLYRHRLPGSRRKDDATEMVHGLWRRELDERNVREARSKKAPLPKLFKESVKQQRKVAKAFREELARTGILLEANPSSNLAVGGLDTPGQLPVCRTAIKMAGQGATLSSDDPGVFGTNLEMEYGLVYAGLLEKGMDSHQAVAVLERIRESTLNARFG